MRVRVILFIISSLILTIFSGCISLLNAPPKSKTSSHHISRLTVTDGFLYFGAGYCFYQLDITTQTLNEIICTPDWLFQQPTIYGQHAYSQVRVAPGLGAIYVAVNLSSGDVLWSQRRTSGYVPPTDKLYVANDIVYTTQKEGIVARDAETGEVIWQTNHNWMLDAGVPEGGLIWYPISREKTASNSFSTPENNANGALVGIDSAHGKIQKIINLLPEARFSELLYIDNQRVIGLDRRNACKIFSINRRDIDQIEWEYKLPRCYGYTIFPTIHEDLFIFETSEEVLALNLSTGQEVWSISLLDIELFQPKDTTVVLPFCGIKQVPGWNPEYTLYGVDVINGLPIWTYQLNQCLEPIVVSETIYISNQESIDTLDLKTGQLLWQTKIETSFEFFAD